MHLGQLRYRFGGQPSSIAFDRENNLLYVADMAHQAILIKSIEDKQSSGSVNEVVSENNQGMPFIGPNSIVISLNLSIQYTSRLDALFFTDSGPFGETSNENPRGSVYMFEIDSHQPKALA